jgi:hypothetical protein
MRALAAALCVCLLSSCLSADLSSLSRLSAEVSAGADVEAEAGDAELQAARDAAFIEALLAQTASDAGDSVFAASADDGGAGGGGDGAEAAPPAAMFVEVGAEAQAAAGALTESGAMSLVEMEKVHNYCEICTRMMQMFQRALPDLCSGLTDTFFISVRGGSEGARRASGWAPPPPPPAQASPMPPPPPAVFLFATPPLSSPLPPARPPPPPLQCVKNMESLLKADRAVVYWHQVGCIHLDDGPEIVKPCPAHAMCGWIPNIFARRVGVTQSIGQLAPLCPRDYNFMPRVPRTLAPAGLSGS